MRKYFGPIGAFTKANLLRFFRDKVYIFFMMVLPVMFLFLFGMIFGNNSTSVNVAIFNESENALAEQIVEIVSAEESVFEIKDVDDRADAEEQLVRGEVDAIIDLPEDFGVPNEQHVPSGQILVTFNETYAEAGQMVSAVLDAVIAEFNNEISGQTPSLTVVSEAFNKTGLSNFDYVFAGLLGYTILTIGLMGIANILPGDKESGATKRLRATTVSASQLILSYALTFLVVGVLIMAIMIALGLTVFDFQMRGNWLTFSVFATISTVMMLGFGLAVGGWAKNEAQASALANLLMFPMMFLSGVFFPKFFMPEFMQNIMGFVPLTPIVDGIRLIITENYTLIDVLPQLGVIGVWGVIIYGVAIKTFRWE